MAASNDDVGSTHLGMLLAPASPPSAPDTLDLRWRRLDGNFSGSKARHREVIAGEFVDPSIVSRVPGSTRHRGFGWLNGPFPGSEKMATGVGGRVMMAMSDLAESLMDPLSLILLRLFPPAPFPP